MKTVVVALVVVIAVLGGFYGGYKVGQSNVKAATNSSSGSGRTGGNGFTRGGGTFANACPSPGSTASKAGTQAVARGQITSITATAMTVNTGTCSVTIDFATGTVVIKEDSGSTSDLQDSQTVTVLGTRQADGSVKATSIAIGGGNFPAGPGGGGAGASPSS